MPEKSHNHDEMSSKYCPVCGDKIQQKYEYEEGTLAHTVEKMLESFHKGDEYEIKNYIDGTTDKWPFETAEKVKVIRSKNPRKFWKTFGEKLDQNNLAVSSFGKTENGEPAVYIRRRKDLQKH